MPDAKEVNGLEGLETKELPIVAMHERVDSATAASGP